MAISGNDERADLLPKKQDHLECETSVSYSAERSTREKEDVLELRLDDLSASQKTRTNRVIRQIESRARQYVRRVMPCARDFWETIPFQRAPSA